MEERKVEDIGANKAKDLEDRNLVLSFSKINRAFSVAGALQPALGFLIPCCFECHLFVVCSLFVRFSHNHNVHNDPVHEERKEKMRKEWKKRKKKKRNTPCGQGVFMGRVK